MSHWHCLQEDFIILEHDELANCWRFVTGVAAFSFVELGINGEKGFMTPGASMASIHTPVPGFNPTIHDQVTIIWLTDDYTGVHPSGEQLLQDPEG